MALSFSRNASRSASATRIRIAQDASHAIIAPPPPLASGAHKAGKIHFDDINLKRGYNVVRAYSQSKLANVLFAKELSKRLKDRGITVNCCHPGAVATNMGVSRETGFGKTITGLLKPFFQTPAEGARTAIFLATDESVKDISGEYFYRCKIAKSSRRSNDPELAKKLYEFSEALVKEKTQNAFNNFTL